MSFRDFHLRVKQLSTKVNRRDNAHLIAVNLTSCPWWKRRLSLLLVNRQIDSATGNNHHLWAQTSLATRTI